MANEPDGRNREVVASEPVLRQARMTIRVYSVSREGVVQQQPEVKTDGCPDPSVTANPLRYPPCLCNRCMAGS
jgi:hypothetical protein